MRTVAQSIKDIASWTIKSKFFAIWPFTRKTCRPLAQMAGWDKTFCEGDAQTALDVKKDSATEKCGEKLCQLKTPWWKIGLTYSKKEKEV